MRVLIVAKTHMGKYACVGGLALDTNTSVRLLRKDASNQPADTPFEVGQVWDLQSSPRLDIEPPHVEDVLVVGGEHINEVADMRSFLLQRVTPWRGDPGRTFDNLVRATYLGSGYINDIMGVPSMSTGFWLPDKDLSLFKSADGREYYLYPRSTGVRTLRYVGFAPNMEMIRAGTLVRLSLARWWKPEDAIDVEARCYLQLSGWY